MNRRSVGLVLALALWCCSSGGAWGQDDDGWKSVRNARVQTKSDAGYVILFPTSWKVYRQNVAGSIGDFIKLDYPNLPKMDFSTYDLFAVPTEAKAGLATNAGVGVLADHIAVNEDNRKAYQQIVEREMNEQGVRVSQVTSRLDSSGKTPCITVEYQVEVDRQRLRERRHLFAGNGKSFELIVSCLSDQFAQASPDFDDIRAHFQVPDYDPALAVNQTDPFSSNEPIRAVGDKQILWLIIAGIGLIVLVLGGAVVFAVVSSKKKARKRAERRAARLGSR